MSTTHKTPGIALVFNDEVWFIPAKDYDDVKRKIDTIKEELVREDGPFKGNAYKLSKEDYVELAKLEAEDVKSLLTEGITIRPMGR